MAYIEGKTPIYRREDSYLLYFLQYPDVKRTAIDRRTRYEIMGREPCPNPLLLLLLLLLMWSFLLLLLLHLLVTRKRTRHFSLPQLLFMLHGHQHLLLVSHPHHLVE